VFRYLVDIKDCLAAAVINNKRDAKQEEFEEKNMQTYWPKGILANSIEGCDFMSNGVGIFRD
jgi:hypothetical protein